MRRSDWQSSGKGAFIPSWMSGDTAGHRSSCRAASSAHAALRWMSEIGPFATCRDARSMSAIRGESDSLCSHRPLPLMTAAAVGAAVTICQATVNSGAIGVFSGYLDFYNRRRPAFEP
jgi:hypothetical protein